MEQKNSNQKERGGAKRGGAKITVILIFAVIILIGAGIAFYYFIISEPGKEKTKTSTTTTTNTPTITNTTAPTNTTTIPTSKWQTYTNEEYGYNLSYPGDWSHYKTSTENPAMFFDPEAMAQNLNVSEMLQGSKIEIYVTEGVDMTLDEILEAEEDFGFEVLSKENTTVGGQPAVKRAVIALSYTNVTYVIHNNNLYSIVQYIPEDEYRQIYSDYYDQMLDSFQFTY